LTAADGKPEEAMVRGASVRRVRDLLAVCCGDEESATCTVKLEVPALVAVPVIAPELEPSDSPAGKEPELMEKVNGAVPPVVLMEPE
jgi:hypothetical protein